MSLKKITEYEAIVKIEGRYFKSGMIMPTDYFANILSPSSTEVKSRDYTYIGVVYARKTMQMYQQTHAQRVGIGFPEKIDSECV